MLAEHRDLREVFVSLFPTGLVFSPARTTDGARQIWRISGSADLSSFVDRSGPVCIATPTGFEPEFQRPKTNSNSRPAILLAGYGRSESRSL